jgi:putative oxidoreductase
MFDALAKNTVAPLVMRLGLAVVFIYHGLGKVSQETAWGTTWAGTSPQALPAAVQFAVAWGELVGGIALALGFLTRFAAAGIAVIMAGAIYLVHWRNGFDIRNQGYEYNFTLLVLCAGVILLGGGTLSLDRMLRVRPRTGK